MFHIWCERMMPEEYRPMLDGVAEFIGSASEFPDTPLVALPRAHAVIAGGRLKYNAEFMDQAPDLKAVVRTGIGYDSVDLNHATRQGIVVCNTPDGPTQGTAEHAITLLLCVAKEIRRNQNEVERGARTEYVSVSQSTEVRDKTLGLVGLGRVGATVARLAKGLGMQVIGYDPFVTDRQADEIGVKLQSSLEAVLGSADFVSLHMPLTAETQHLMNAERFAQMKQGSFLINCARGGVVDEAALIQTLDEGHLAGAGLDVFSHEPPPPDHPLLKRDNVVATPHIAGGTVEGKQRMWRKAIQQVVQVLQGERPEYVVNPEVYDAAT